MINNKTIRIMFLQKIIDTNYKYENLMFMKFFMAFKTYVTRNKKIVVYYIVKRIQSM